MKLKRVALGLLAVLVLSVATAMAVAWHEGYRAYVVRTGSMVPTFRPGDAVLDRPASAGYAVGDPITVAIGPDVLVTHRLTRIDTYGLLHTKGDANPSADAWQLPSDRVRGVVGRVLPDVGFLMVFLQQRTGVASVMTSALAIVLLWSLCFPSEQPEPAPERSVRVPRQRVAGETAPAQVVGTGRT